jgi:hypothetical protein
MRSPWRDSLILFPILLALWPGVSLGDAGLADGGVGSKIRCKITAPADVPRTDIFMDLATCSALGDASSCTWKTWLQTGAVRRAFLDRVEFDWTILPGEKFYYGQCRLCLTDWREETHDFPQCATSAPLLLGTTNGVPLPEAGLWVGVVAAAAFLVVVAMLAGRILK